MQANIKKLRFIGIEGDGQYRWRATAKGQDIFDVTVNINDPDLTICAHRLDGTRIERTTGRAVKRDEFITDPDGQLLGMASRVSTDSVKSYVIPRRHRILAALYVPGFDILTDANKQDEQPV